MEDLNQCDNLGCSAKLTLPEDYYTFTILQKVTTQEQPIDNALGVRLGAQPLCDGSSYFDNESVQLLPQTPVLNQLVTINAYNCQLGSYWRIQAARDSLVGLDRTQNCTNPDIPLSASFIPTTQNATYTVTVTELGNDNGLSRLIDRVSFVPTSVITPPTTVEVPIQVTVNNPRPDTAFDIVFQLDPGPIIPATRCFTLSGGALVGSNSCTGAQVGESYTFYAYSKNSNFPVESNRVTKVITTTPDQILLTINLPAPTNTPQPTITNTPVPTPSVTIMDIVNTLKNYNLTSPAYDKNLDGIVNMIDFALITKLL